MRYESVHGRLHRDELDWNGETINDPERFEDVPNGVMLVLIPDDEPEYLGPCIERGIEDFKRGYNAYFRHFLTKRMPPRDDPPSTDEG